MRLGHRFTRAIGVLVTGVSVFGGGCRAQLPGVMWAHHAVSGFAADSSVRLTMASPRYESGTIAVPAATEAVMSWNVDVPADSTAVFEMRVAFEAAPEEWSPWLFMGDWGASARAAARHIGYESPGGRLHVEIDVLTATRPFSRAQWRVTGFFAGQDEPLIVRRVDITTTAAHAPVSPTRPEGASVSGVPFFTQRTDDPKLSGRLCSPTSVTMVLGYFGRMETVQSIAARARDPEHDIYGNWPRNVQTAYSFGVPGRIARFSDWESAARVLREGTPIVISFSADPGELRGAPYVETAGHLVVLTGLTPTHGLVNDPAVGDDRRGRLRYRLDDLTRCWMNNGKGTAYVLGPAGEGGGGAVDGR